MDVASNKTESMNSWQTSTDALLIANSRKQAANTFVISISLTQISRFVFWFIGLYEN